MGEVDLARVAEVWNPARKLVGTGFRIADGLVLTAAHVADADDLGVEVRLYGTDSWVPVRAEPLTASGHDASVLRVMPGAGFVPPATEAPPWGRVVGTAPVPVHCVCFPKATARDDGARDTAYVAGWLYPAHENLEFRRGAGVVHVKTFLPTRRDEDGSQSESGWSGASGAAVFAEHSGQLIGVITADHDIAGAGDALTFALVAAVPGLAGTAGAAVADVPSSSPGHERPGLVDPASVDAPPGLIRLRALTGAAPGLFVGRGSEMARLREALAHGPGVITQALTGLGGIGKSTLAARYARDHASAFNPVWWIDAETPAQLQAGLADLAAQLHPPVRRQSPEQATDWGRRWLRAHSGWLVVLDNVTRVADVADLIADCGRGRFLATSRTTVGWAGVAAATRLPVLPLGDALRMLRSLVGDELMTEGAAKLCHALGCLPLGIELAGAYMLENAVPAEVYLKRLTDPALKVLGWTPTGADAQRTVALIWQVSVDRIGAQYGPLPGELLRALAWWGPDDIPVQLLYRSAGEAERGGEAEVDEAEVDEALGRLASYALIVRTGDGLSVHRLVQAASRSGLFDAADIAVARDRAVRALLAVVPAWKDPAGWPTWRRLTPHITALADHRGTDTDDAAMADLLYAAADYLLEQGQLAAARVFYERALAGRLRVLGEDHPDTLAARNNLAFAHREAGDLETAIQLYERNLADRERILGADHPDTLASRNNLAYAYRPAGRLEQAIAMYEQSLADRTRVLGADHPQTSETRTNLAFAYREAGDVARAVPLYERVLADRARVLGADHPDTLAARNNLASAYRSAGDLGRALPLQERTLADRLRVLGPDHPQTLTSQNTVAYAYREAGRLAEAVALYEKTLADRLRVLGEDHPDTLASRNNLARAYRLTGDLPSAVAMYERTLADRLRILGAEHPQTLTSRHNLAYALRAAGELERAIAMYEAAWEGRRRVLGADHRQTRASAEGLAGARGERRAVG